MPRVFNIAFNCDRCYVTEVRTLELGEAIHLPSKWMKVGERIVCGKHEVTFRFLNGERYKTLIDGESL